MVEGSLVQVTFDCQELKRNSTKPNLTGPKAPVRFFERSGNQNVTQ